jgi:hypothetical protein
MEMKNFAFIDCASEIFLGITSKQCQNLLPHTNGRKFQIAETLFIIIRGMPFLTLVLKAGYTLPFLSLRSS